MTFRLLKLPFLAFRHIVKQMDPVDTLILTQECRVFEKIISANKSLQIPCDHFTWIFARDSTTLSLYFDRDDVPEPFTRTNGDPNRFNFKISHSDKKRSKKAEDYTRRLMSVLKVDKFTLKYVRVDMREYENCYVYEYARKFEEVTLALVDHIEDQKRFFFENIEANVLNCDTSITGIEPEPLRLNHERILFGCPVSIEFSSVLNMKSKDLITRQPIISMKIEDYITFLKSWIEMKEQADLEEFYVRVDKLSRFDFDIGFNGEELREAVFKELDRMDVIVEEPEFEAIRLIERSDGRKAYLAVHSYFQLKPIIILS